MQETHRDDFDVETLDRLARDARARRELLWLLAMIQGDLGSARDLEAVDPKLRGRLAPVVARHFRQERSRQGATRPTSELYEAIWTERYAHHAARHRGLSCACGECAGRRPEPG